MNRPKSPIDIPTDRSGLPDPNRAFGRNFDPNTRNQHLGHQMNDRQSETGLKTIQVDPRIFMAHNRQSLSPTSAQSSQNDTLRNEL